jgi:hypothetical protein
MGLAIPQATARATDAAVPILDTDGDQPYEIERVSHAERVGNVYKIWLKWRGYDELLYRWRHELVKETTNLELLGEIDAAVADARERYRAQHSSYAEQDDEQDDDTSDVPPVGLPPLSLASQLGPVSGRLRHRHPRLLFTSPAVSATKLRPCALDYDYHTTIVGGLFYVDLLRY